MANIIGSSGKDTLTGSNSKDTIVALGDDDIVDGRGGNDTIDGDAGSDTLFGGAGNDTILGGAGADFIHGGAGNDLIGLTDNSRNGTPSGGAGDVIYGDRFNTYSLVSGSVVGQDLTAATQLGDDTIYGTSDADTIWGDNGDKPNGSTTGGHDTIFAGNGADTLYGEGGNDALSGEGGDDNLSGGDGKDTISGGDGNDILIGGAAANVLDGGAGDDHIIYNAAADSAANKIDTINGFVSGYNYSSGDKIDITALGQPGNDLQWQSGGAIPSMYGAWFQPVTGGVRLMADVTGDAVADYQVFFQGLTSLRHSDILGVVNNAPLLIGEVTNADDPVVEAGSNSASDPNASGTVALGFNTDGDALLVANVGVQEGTYGDLSLEAEGAWTYLLDNSRPATDALTDGQEVTETFDLILTDGSLTSNTISIVITISGADDNTAPVLATASMGAIVRANTDAFGGQSNGGLLELFHPSFSPDGNRLVFGSDASNLVEGDGNAAADVFVKDLVTGATTRVSTDALGNEANGLSFGAVFSPDGSRVAFASQASNLVSGDVNDAQDIFVKDLASGAVTLISVNEYDVQGDRPSFNPVFSPDGSKVLFLSNATNLVTGDVALTDIFIKDLVTGTVTLISADADGVQGNGFHRNPVFSPDGSKVAFESLSFNWGGDANADSDVFLKDLVTNELTLVNTNSGGIQGNGRATAPVFSPDGNMVMFTSSASNLVTGDTNGSSADVFLKDLATGAVTLMSTDANGVQGNFSSGGGVFSSDGSKLAFGSSATNLVASDTNSETDVFVKDLTTNVVTIVSTNLSGVQGNSFSVLSVLSPDGSRVAFVSDASNLVEEDTNGGWDLFVKDISESVTAGQVTEDMAVTSGNLIATGTVKFVDVDLADTHSVTATPVDGAYRGTFNATITDVATGDGAGRVAWDYSVANDDVQDLVEGQMLIQDYTVTVTDNHGGSFDQLVTITIVGADEALP